MIGSRSINLERFLLNFLGPPLKAIPTSLVAGFLALNQSAFAVAPEDESLLHSDRHSQTVRVPRTTFRSTSDSDPMRKAEVALRAGDRALAISIFREIVRLESNNLKVRIKLSAALADTGNFDEARSQNPAGLGADVFNSRFLRISGTK